LHRKTPNPRAVAAGHGDPTWTHGFPRPDETALHAAQNTKQMSHNLKDGFNTLTNTNPICTANTKPHIILQDTLPNNHMYIPPTPGTRETTLIKTIQIPNTHPQKPWLLDTTADCGVPDNAESPRPPPDTAVPGMQRLHPTPHTRLQIYKNMQTNVLIMHHVHITMVHIHNNRLQGPTHTGPLRTKPYVAIPLAAHDLSRGA